MYVSSQANLYGSNNVLAAGTVIKFAPGPTNYPSIVITGPGGALTSLASAYRESVFTSVSDDTIGEILPASTHSPGTNFYGAPAIEFDNTTGGQAADFHDARIAYAQTAIQFSDGTNHLIRHVA